ncbi:hypothetical protein EW15_1417 [Prochlorococcus sp. MIT 0801]|nr:hypothetical protein EW15_1417 [Prochlorococcus sp. MIT 0801]
MLSYLDQSFDWKQLIEVQVDYPYSHIYFIDLKLTNFITTDKQS